MTKNDGGPAFPQSTHPDGPFGGMTLRDWFAGQVIGAVFTRSNLSPESDAYEAYQIADAMIKAREGEG